MELKIQKTPEISDTQWQQIISGYNESFDLNETLDTLKEGFCVSNKQGWSYHCFAYSDEGDLMGYTEFIPTVYVGGLQIAVGGNTFIRKQYRADFMLFAKIVNELKKQCAQDGCKAIVAVPNINSRDYAIRINRFVYVADLDYYILPLDPSKIIKNSKLRIVDGLTRMCLKGWVYLNYAVSNIWCFKEEEKRIRLDIDDDFYNYRFKNDCYKKIEDGDYRFCYRHYDEDGIDTIYLMDFRYKGTKTSKALNKALKFIVKNDKCDAILFVGFLGLKQTTMIKTPKRFVPKPLPLTYHVIDKNDKELKTMMAKKEAWDFSLMNFDVR